jgi:TctA family transporter
MRCSELKPIWVQPFVLFLIGFGWSLSKQVMYWLNVPSNRAKIYIQTHLPQMEQCEISEKTGYGNLLKVLTQKLKHLYKDSVKCLKLYHRKTSLKFLRILVIFFMVLVLAVSGFSFSLALYIGILVENSKSSRSFPHYWNTHNIELMESSLLRRD